MTIERSQLFPNVAEATAYAVDALAHLHNNIDDISRGYVIRAAVEKRAAYWSSSQYHDQKARNLLDEANDLGAVEAIQLRIRSNGTSGYDNPHRLINTLIPLNNKAFVEIEAARKLVTNDFANVRSF